MAQQYWGQNSNWKLQCFNLKWCSHYFWVMYMIMIMIMIIIIIIILANLGIWVISEGDGYTSHWINRGRRGEESGKLEDELPCKITLTVNAIAWILSNLYSLLKNQYPQPSQVAMCLQWGSLLSAFFQNLVINPITCSMYWFKEGCSIIVVPP